MEELKKIKKIGNGSYADVLQVERISDKKVKIKKKKN